MSNEKLIPLSIPYLDGNEKKYVDECLETGWISSVGVFVDRFEKEFAEYTGAKHAVAVMNGTSALHLSLLVAGIGSNHEVFVPSVTFIAPVNAACYTGANPVFIDVDNESLGISPEAITDFIENNTTFKDGILTNNKTGKHIKAIIPVHICGHSCNLDELVSIADKYNLKLIEDCAEAIGTQYKGSHVGNFGLTGCFSFNGNKTLTTGGGGMVVTNDRGVAEKIRHLSTQAKSDELYYTHDAIGYNYRMTNVLAAIGTAQLEYIDDVINKKREVHQLYLKHLEGIEEVSLFNEQQWCRSNYWMGLLTLPENSRDDFIKFMIDKKIQVRPLWDLNNHQPMFKDCMTSKLDASEKMYSNSVSVPCNQKMNEDDVIRIAQAIKKFFRAQYL